MNGTITGTDYKVEIKRVLNASRERVFDAWVNPDSVQKWMFGQPDWTNKKVTMDARVGGAYRMEAVDNDGDLIAASGVLTEYDPPRHLSLTWKWDVSSNENAVTQVSVSLADIGGKTELTLVHSKLSNEVSQQRHTGGWNHCLDALANFLEGLKA